MPEPLPAKANLKNIQLMPEPLPTAPMIEKMNKWTASPSIKLIQIALQHKTRNQSCQLQTSAPLDQYATYIEDIDLRFNEITDEGAQALADLISKSQRLLGLNLQGNKIKSEGAQFLAEALKECTNL